MLIHISRTEYVTHEQSLKKHCVILILCTEGMTALDVASINGFQDVYAVLQLMDPPSTEYTHDDLEVKTITVPCNVLSIYILVIIFNSLTNCRGFIIFTFCLSLCVCVCVCVFDRP